MRASFALLVGTCLVAVAAPAQQAGHIGLPVDWSSRHIVSHDTATGKQKDPRAIYNALRIQQSRAQQQAGTIPAKWKPLLDRLRQSRAKAHGDWHFPLGNGTMNSNNGAASSDASPAKFSFDVNAAPNCANDYVVYALNVAGSTTQPNLVAFNNLYAGASGSQQNIVKATETGTTATIITQSAHGFTTGQKVIIDGVPNNGYNGTFTITVTNTTTFTYTTAAGLANFNNGGGTATLTNSISSAGESGSTVTITTSAAHGLTAGNYVTVQNVSVSGYNGVYQIASVPTTTSFTYTAATTGLGAGSGGSATGSGLCGLTPTVKFAYNINTSNDILTASPVISLDGTKVAFIGSSGASGGSAYFYVLTLPTSGSSGSWDAANNQYAAVTPGASDNATLVSYKYTTNAQNAFGSSPYVDYVNDVAYFGDDKGNFYKTTCAFSCSGNPATASGYPVNFGSKQMSSPVVDLNTNLAFIGSVDGLLYSCNVTNCIGTTNSIVIGNGAANGGIVDGPILDNTFGTMVVTSGQNSGGSFTIVQLDESLNKLVTLTGGAQAFPVPNGAISDEYYNNAVGNTTVAGLSFFCGPVGGSGQADIYTVPFTQPSRTVTNATESGTTVTITTLTNHGFTAGDTVVIAGVGVAGYNGTFTIVSTPTAKTFTVTNATTGLANSSGGTAVQQQLTATNPPTLGTATLTAIAGPNKATCSPMTILTNGSARLFFSQPKAPCPSGGAADGCLFAYTFNTSTGVVTQAATSDQHSGTSGMIVDNISNLPQASSLYFATQAKSNPNTTSAPSCTYGAGGAAGYCAVKVTQSALQ